MRALTLVKTLLIKDTRLLRVHLVLWGLVLVHALCVRLLPWPALGVVSLLPQLQVLALAALVSPLVLLDPVRGADHFWRTRPIPRPVLLASKLLWWGLFILLPGLATQITTLWGLDLESTTWVRLLAPTVLGVVLMSSGCALVALGCTRELEFWLAFAAVGVVFLLSAGFWAGLLPDGTRVQPISGPVVPWALGLSLLIATVAIPGRYLGLSSDRYFVLAGASLLLLALGTGGVYGPRSRAVEALSAAPVLSIAPIPFPSPPTGTGGGGPELVLALRLEEGIADAIYEIRHLSAHLVPRDGRVFAGHLLGSTLGKLEVEPRPYPWPLAASDRGRELRLAWVPQSPSLPAPDEPATLVLGVEVWAETRPEVVVVPLRYGGSHRSELESSTVLGVERDAGSLAILFDEWRIAPPARVLPWGPCTYQDLLVNRVSSETQSLQGQGSTADISGLFPLPLAPPFSFRSRHRYRFDFVFEQPPCQELEGDLVERSSPPPPDWLLDAELVRLRSATLGKFDLELRIEGYTVGDWVHGLRQARAEIDRH